MGHETDSAVYLIKGFLLIIIEYKNRLLHISLVVIILHVFIFINHTLMTEKLGFPWVRDANAFQRKIFHGYFWEICIFLCMNICHTYKNEANSR